jgi:hypothetical protein
MTVSSTINREQYDTDGVTTAFTIHFPFFDDTDVNAIVVDADGDSTTLALNTDFTVTGGSGSGGTLTCTTAPADGGSLTIYRQIPYTQETVYVADDPLPADSLNGDIDRATIRDLQIKDAQDRALTFPVTIGTDVSAELPNPSGNTYLGWNSAGDALENKTLPEGTTVYASLASTNAGTATDEAVTPAGLANSDLAQLVDDNTADLAARVLATNRNRLINPGFAIDQRGNSATDRDDDAYCVDGWYVLTQTDSVQVTQQTLQEDGQPFSVRLTQNQSTAQRFGLAQIIAASECRDLRGQSGVLSGRIRCSAAQKINYAILGWTGTADTVTSDVVSDWTDTDLTAGNFFLASNVTVIKTGSITPAAATWTDLDEITAALGSTFNNIIVMVWTDGTAAQNLTLDIGKMKFEAGDTATPFEYMDLRLELVRCRRLYRTFKGLAGAQYSTTAAAVQTIIDPPMRATPTSDLALSSLSIIGIGAVSDLGTLSVAINTADYFQAAATFTTAGAVGRPVSAVLTGGLSAEL